MIILYCLADGILIGNLVFAVPVVLVDPCLLGYQLDLAAPEKALTDDLQSDARFYRE